MVGMESGVTILPILILGCARVVAARQERIWTRALTGDRCRVCSKPMVDLSLSKRVSMMKRLPNSTVSSRGSS